MKKPQKTDYGWNEETGWTQGDKARFEYATETWRIVNQKPGRQRTRPIHPSWNDVLQNFDSANPQRSQGAFCRWAGIKPATFSNWKNKPLSDDVERCILEWDYIGDGQGLDGSMNTNQDRVKKEVQNG